MNQIKKVLIIAGEESGDIYAAEIAKNLKNFHSNTLIYGIGGENLKNQEAILIEHIKNLSFLGLVEVLKHIPDVYKILTKVKEFLTKERPDFVILIDFPDFNFKVAKFAKKIGIKVYYFISPQVWAWRRGRVKFIKKYIDRLFVIFPFEEDFYKSYGISAKFVGHPLAKKIKDFKKKYKNKINNDLLTIGLLPGSRVKEVKKHLPIMLNAVSKIKNVKILIGVAKNIDTSTIEYYTKEFKNIKLIEGNSYYVMHESDIIVSTSGTATLESALFGKPVIIVYKVNLISYIIGRLLIKIPYIGMPNLLLGEKNNPELIQFDFNSEKLYIEIMKLLKNKEKTEKVSKKNLKLMNFLYRENIFDFLMAL